MRLYDAHNHLQDERLRGTHASLLRIAETEGVVKMVVNGASEEDWPNVLGISKTSPILIPSFGYPPWHVRDRTRRWQQQLLGYLDQVPAAIGEIGLDR